jgi:transcription elongation factor GreA-like protein
MLMPWWPDRERLLLSSQLGVWQDHHRPGLWPVHHRFSDKPGHAMDLAFAAESLKPISKRPHLRAQSFRFGCPAPNGRAASSGLDQAGAAKLWQRATLDQIQQVLVPDVIKDDWKKWWEAAKRELKKDGHFQVPSRKPSRLFTKPRKSRCKAGSWPSFAPPRD